MQTMILNRMNREGCPLNPGSLIVWGLALATVVIQSLPSLGAVLQWNRDGGLAVNGLSCHLCHWSWDHLLWDLFAFVLLSQLALRLRPSRYVPCLLVAGLLIPLEVQLNQEALASYRGLSGIDCALLGLVVSALWQSDGGTGRSFAPRFLALLAAGGFVAKTGYELLTGSTVFVESGLHAFVPVPSAHLVGFVAGVVTGLFRERSANSAREGFHAQRFRSKAR